MRKYLMFWLLMGMMAGISEIRAQEKPGMDSLECLKNYSLYKESLKKKMYAYAIDPWRKMFDECPDVTIRLYADGVNIYKHYIKVEKDEARRQGLIDTLLMIYDQRIKYFGEHPKYSEGWIMGRKGVDIVTYRRNDVNSLKEAVECFEFAYGKQHNRLEPTVAVNWLQATNALLKNGDLSGSVLLDVYLNVDEILNTHIAKTTNEKKKTLLNRVSSTCGEILAKSGFDDCATLEAQLQDRFDMVKDDQKGIERLLFLLDGLDCTDSQLYAKAAEQNYALQPTPKAAYLLAKYFIKQNQFDKAKDYYMKTISQSEDEEMRAKCFYELAVITFSHFRNSPQARTYAQNAIKIKQGWGKPHILIGNIYAQESSKYGKDDFEHSTVYWVALDRFKKARAVDPECTKEADKQISLYSQYIPDKETGFFHGIKEGDAYTIGSWINEKTTVRYR